jgi:pyrimidine operon attenuation protein/uracil phosphoribosyltransferase
MRAMRTLADAKKVDQLVSGLTEAILADMDAATSGDDGWALVGIRSRGEILADRIAEKLGRDRIDDRVGSLDITLYRDDLSEIGSAAVVRTTDIDFAIDGLNVVLIDDVLMTGRSIRAALQSLMDLGRPRRVWLAVLVDRGGRELPIGPDHVGLDLSHRADGSDTVDVLLKPTDKKDAIVLRHKQRQQRNAS